MTSLAQSIDEADFFLFVIPANLLRSQWNTDEFFHAYMSDIYNQNPKIIPIRIDDVEVPSQAQSLFIPDLFQNYDSGFQILLKTILQTPDEPLAQFSIDEAYDRKTIITVSDLVGRQMVDHFVTPRRDESDGSPQV